MDIEMYQLLLLLLAAGNIACTSYVSGSIPGSGAAARVGIPSRLPRLWSPWSDRVIKDKLPKVASIKATDLGSHFRALMFHRFHS